MTPDQAVKNALVMIEDYARLNRTTLASTRSRAHEEALRVLLAERERLTAERDRQRGAAEKHYALAEDRLELVDAAEARVKELEAEVEQLEDDRDSYHAEALDAVKAEAHANHRWGEVKQEVERLRAAWAVVRESLMVNLDFYRAASPDERAAVDCLNAALAQPGAAPKEER